MRHLLLTLALCLLTSAATGQKAHYVHDFDSHKVYLQFGATETVSWLRTVRWEDHQCANIYTSPVDILDDGDVEFRGGTVWEITYKGKRLRIHMPSADTTITYRPTEKTVRDLCTRKEAI